MTIPRFNPIETSGGIVPIPGVSDAPPVTRGQLPHTDTKNTVFDFHPETKISANFDWLRICGKDKPHKARVIFADWFDPQPGKSQGRGYEQLTWGKYKSAFLQGRPHNPDAWQVEITGGACKDLDETLPHVAKSLLSLGGWCTRIDAAVDVHSPHGGLEGLLDIFQHQISIYRAGSKIIHGNLPRDGRTIQIGSSAADRYVRVYDKSAQMYRIPGEWVRYEAQINRKRAMTLTDTLLQSDNWHKLAQGLAADTNRDVQTMLPEIYDFIFQGQLQTTAIEDHKVHLEKFKKHCRNSCFMTIKALAKECNLTPEQVLELLDFYETEPSTLHSRHSGLIFSIKDIAKGSH